MRVSGFTFSEKFVFTSVALGAGGGCSPLVPQYYWWCRCSTWMWLPGFKDLRMTSLLILPNCAADCVACYQSRALQVPDSD